MDDTDLIALAIGRTQTTRDLIDVNGDGLPDLVERSGATVNVRLNLGSIGSRLHRLNSRSTHTRSRSLRLMLLVLSLSLTRGPSSGPPHP